MAVQKAYVPITKAYRSIDLGEDSVKIVIPFRRMKKKIKSKHIFTIAFDAMRYWENWDGTEQSTPERNWNDYQCRIEEKQSNPCIK